MKNYFKLYSDFLLKGVKLNRKIKIIVDASNGISGEVFKSIKNSSLDFTLINTQLSGDFPAHGPNPLADNATEELKKMIIKERADFGVILDGDGDRAIFCDNLGRDIHTDIMMRLLISALNPKKIILDPRNGYLIKNYCNEHDIEMIECKAGRYFIQKAMNEENADLGVETAGHYHFAFNIKGEIYHFDSAVRAIIEIAQIVSELPYSLANFIDLLPEYYRIKETNFEVLNKEGVIQKIEKSFYSKATRVSRLDGLTMEFSDETGKWWFNIRPSANDPVLRLNMEAENNNILNEKFSLIRNLIVE